MKKTLYRLLLLVALLCGPMTMQAQDANVMKEALEGYKNLSTMTAKVKKTVHNEMVTKDVVTTGTFYFKKPARMLISTNGGKDKLLTDGENFTIVQDGKASTAKGKGNSALGPLVEAIRSITSGKEADLSDVADVDVEREGNLMIMTIAPIVQKAADRKKMIYSSFVITIDTKASELRSVRLNGKGKNWDLYEFSGYNLKATVDDSVFKL